MIAYETSAPPGTDVYPSAKAFVGLEQEPQQEQEVAEVRGGELISPHTLLPPRSPVQKKGV